jgi:hypothetical protein
MTHTGGQTSKAVQARATARYRERHPDRVKAARKKSMVVELARARKRRADSVTWGKEVIRGIRHRAKREGRLCTINAADILVPEFCPVLGIKLQAGLGTPIDSSPSVDRFYNDEGYTSENIRVISHRANQLKRDATIDELQRVVAYMQGEYVSRQR